MDDSSETHDYSYASREKLRRVAKYQRWIMFALSANFVLTLCYLALVVAVVSTPHALGPRPDIMYLVYLFGFSTLLCGIAVLTMVSCFLLAKRFFNIIIAILCGLTALVPPLSLIVMLALSIIATKHLKQHGIRVGFFGVNPSTIRVEN